MVEFIALEMAYKIPDNDKHYFRFDMAICSDQVFISLGAYRITRTTPKSVFLDVWGRERRVQHNWVKRFAAPTKQEAWKDFIARQKAALNYARIRAYAAAAALDNRAMPQKDRAIPYRSTNPFNPEFNPELNHVVMRGI